MLQCCNVASCYGRESFYAFKKVNFHHSFIIHKQNKQFMLMKKYYKLLTYNVILCQHTLCPSIYNQNTELFSTYLGRQFHLVGAAFLCSYYLVYITIWWLQRYLLLVLLRYANSNIARQDELRGTRPKSPSWPSCISEAQNSTLLLFRPLPQLLHQTIVTLF